MSESPEKERRKGALFARLKAGLAKTAQSLTGSIGAIFTGRKLDRAMLDELEEALIAADLGIQTASDLVETLSKQKLGREVTDEEVRTALATEIAQILAPVARPLAINPSNKPHVILVAGVNGTGKTTTIGKLASQFRAEGRSVTLAAGDTFRAAAVEQLKIWGSRAGCPVIARADTGADAAGLAFEALEGARVAKTDVLIIDTAGRLQNKAHLMDELKKIDRVLKKLDPAAPHTRLLVLDATTGQNAHSQVEVFKEAVKIDGLVMTKLDGTAKGGVVVALAKRFGLPIVALGVGEGIDDLRPFEPDGFARALLGLN